MPPISFLFPNNETIQFEVLLNDEGATKPSLST